VCDRLEARRPSAIVVLTADQVRDVDVFVHWYGAAAYGPWLLGKATRRGRC